MHKWNLFAYCRIVICDIKYKRTIFDVQIQLFRHIAIDLKHYIIS